jgi:hypothetical protein
MRRRGNDRDACADRSRGSQGVFTCASLREVCLEWQRAARYRQKEDSRPYDFECGRSAVRKNPVLALAAAPLESLDATFPVPCADTSVSAGRARRTPDPEFRHGTVLPDRTRPT